MLYLLQSWKESLSLFIPKNFKLFLLVTLKSTLELYGNLIYFFWWLIFSVFVFLVGLYYPAWATTGLLWLFVGNLLMISLIFVWFMLARPSVLPKGYSYFKQHIKKTAFGFLGIYMIFNLIRALLLSLTTKKLIGLLLTGAFLNPLYIYLMFRLEFIPFMVFPPFVCAVLFYFDSDGCLEAWFRSFIRGSKMYIYNLPFCILSMFLVFLICMPLLMLFPGYAEYVLWLFIPFVLSYFKNMYVKRLHDQFNLYFANE